MEKEFKQILMQYYVDHSVGILELDSLYVFVAPILIL